LWEATPVTDDGRYGYLTPLFRNGSFQVVFGWHALSSEGRGEPPKHALRCSGRATRLFTHA
jgi:hypothetical protein